MTKLILSWILSYRVGQLRFLVAKTYLETISQLYRSANFVFGIIFFIGLFTGGVVLMAFGIAMIIPVTTEGRGIIMLSIGTGAFVISLVGYFFLNSEKRWIKSMHVESVLKEISGERS